MAIFNSYAKLPKGNQYPTLSIPRRRWDQPLSKCPNGPVALPEMTHRECFKRMQVFRSEQSVTCHHGHHLWPFSDLKPTFPASPKLQNQTKTEQDWPLTSAKSGKKIHIFPTIVLSKHPRISIPIGTLAVAVTGAPPSVSMRYLGPKADVPVHQTRSATAWLFNGKLHRPKYFICSPWVHSLHISNICMEFLSSTVHVWSKPKFCSRSVRACALSNARIVCVYPTKTSET